MNTGFHADKFCTPAVPPAIGLIRDICPCAPAPRRTSLQQLQLLWEPSGGVVLNFQSYRAFPHPADLPSQSRRWELFLRRGSSRCGVAACILAITASSICAAPLAPLAGWHPTRRRGYVSWSLRLICGICSTVNFDIAWCRPSQPYAQCTCFVSSLTVFHFWFMPIRKQVF
jgi:hypothetical protein